MAAYDLTRKLIERGYKRIGYTDMLVGSLPIEKQHYSRSARRDGCLQALEEAGLEPICYLGQDRDLKKQVDCLSAWISENKLDAVVDYASAQGTLLAHVLPKLGIRVGDEFQVCSFGDEVRLEMSMCYNVVVDDHALAKQRCILMELIKEPKTQREPLEIPMKIIEPTTLA